MTSNWRSSTENGPIFRPKRIAFSTSERSATRKPGRNIFFDSKSYHHLVNTKCRSMVYSNKQVFTTDIGLGCYYVTNVDNGSTIAVERPSILTGVTSIAVDPSGNVIVKDGINP